MIGPPPKINLGDLKRATPTAMTPATLKTQLGNVGLDCGELNDNDLQRYINEVSGQLYKGQVQTFLIEKPIQNLRSFSSRNYEKAATGNWEPSQTAQGFSNVLQVVQYPKHFDWLYQNRGSNGFTGEIVSPPPETGYYDNATAIKNLFVTVSLSASSALVKGLDEASMEASLHNAISPLRDEHLSNYDNCQNGDPADENCGDSRVMYLVLDYDPVTEYAQGIGVLSTQWRLTIKDFKQKTKDGGDTHETYIRTKSRAVLYEGQAGVNILCAHFNSVVQHFKLDTPVQCPPY